MDKRNALFGLNDYTTADVLNTPVRRGGILPFTEYVDRTEFDPSSGILGSIGRAFTAPARAYRGEMSDDQQIDEAANLAGWLTLGGYMGSAAQPAKNALMSTYKAMGPADAPADALRRARIAGADRFMLDDTQATTFANKRPSTMTGDELLDAMRARGMGPANSNSATAELFANGRNSTVPGVLMSDALRHEPQGIRAFHGSPHNYKAERLIEWPDGRTEYIEGMPDVLPDVPQGARVIKDFPLGRQRLDKIGTGEGAQAQGYGLYEAGAEDVAHTYKVGLSNAKRNISDDNARLKSAGLTDNQIRQAQPFIDTSDDPERAFMDFVNWIGIKPEQHSDLKRTFVEIVKNKPTGHMYEVRINADPNDFLDWDKPLSQQSEKVQAAFRDVDQFPDIPGKLAYYRKAGLKLQSPETSQTLREAGIPGIRYLDQMSRGEGKGSSNYVVFDDALVEILRKYGLLPPVAAGGLAAALGQEDELY